MQIIHKEVKPKIKITNKYNLPQVIERAVRNDTYDSSGSDISATSLYKPPRILRYMQEYKYEIEHMSKNYNFEGYKFYNKDEIREEINSEMYLAGMLNSGSYHLNPLKLTIGLAKISKQNNVKIFENTPVEKIHEIGDKVKIITKKGVIKANKVVMATNGFYEDDIFPKLNNMILPVISNIVDDFLVYFKIFILFLYIKLCATAIII